MTYDTGMLSSRRQPDHTVWIALAAVTAFAGSLFSAFHFDDYGMLQDRIVISSDGWFRSFGLLQTRPLTWLTFWANYQLHGREPLLWHALNLALHMICAVILYRTLRTLMPEAATLAALLFAVHPIQAEPVDYVYARAIILCTLFSLLAFRDWLRDRSSMAVAWFTAALLAKEECVTIPLLLALYSLYRGDLRRRLAPLAAMLALAFAAGLRLLFAISATGMKNIGPTAGISPLAYLSEQAIAILRYLGLLILPLAFSIDPEIPVPALAFRLLAWLLLAAFIAACIFCFRDNRAARWSLAGLILLIPSSTIFPAADLAADRRMYLPMLALAPAIALLLPVRTDRWKFALIAIFLLLSIHRTYVWASDERLWSEAVRLAPAKVRPRIQLSRALPADQAIAILHEAEALAPQNADVPTELARVYLESNRPADALAQAGRALALSPHDPHALSNRGAVLLALKQTAAARRDFTAALAVDPCLDVARENLALSGGLPADVPACRR